MTKAPRNSLGRTLLEARGRLADRLGTSRALKGEMERIRASSLFDGPVDERDDHGSAMEVEARRNGVVRVHSEHALVELPGFGMSK